MKLSNFHRNDFVFSYYEKFRILTQCTPSFIPLRSNFPTHKLLDLVQQTPISKQNRFWMLTKPYNFLVSKLLDFGATGSNFHTMEVYYLAERTSNFLRLQSNFPTRKLSDFGTLTSLGIMQFYDTPKVNFHAVNWTLVTLIEVIRCSLSNSKTRDKSDFGLVEICADLGQYPLSEQQSSLIPQQHT